AVSRVWIGHDQAGAAQQSNMVRDETLLQVERLHEMANTLVTAAEELQYGETRRVRKRMEHSGHILLPFDCHSPSIPPIYQRALIYHALNCQRSKTTQHNRNIR